MKKLNLIFLILASILTAACSSDKKTGLVQEQEGSTDLIEVVDTNDLERLMATNPEKVKLVNFWATWCKPCVKELPYFQKVRENYSDKVDLHFVSLDFQQDLEKKVKPFVEKNNYGGTHYLMGNTDYNSWLDKVDRNWSGSIPATLVVYPNGKSVFLEKTMEYTELDSLVNL